jgi:hypothetical protein
MHNSNVPSPLRRSSRVPANVPILVTSLAPGTHFSEICETIMVSAHGCAMRSPVQLEAGLPLHFHSRDGRETTAQVVYCQPMSSDSPEWTLAARLDQPANFWGLNACPQDWSSLPSESAEKPMPRLVARDARTSDQAPTPVSPSVKTALEGIQRQVSDPHLRALMAELVRPLQSEVTELKEKLVQRESRRSQFEVSLAQIPPELEQQLELRLRKNLAPRVLEQAREQSAQVLEAAKSAIQLRTAEGHGEFLRRVAQELQAVEQRAQGISSDLADNLHGQLRTGLTELQGQMVDAGNRLKRLSEELLRFLQDNLNEEHNARRQELEQIRATAATESARLQEQVTNLDQRIAQLSGSARELESGLDKRLSLMASNTVTGVRSQLESLVETLLQDLETRNGQELERQLGQACAQLEIVQREAEASTSESLKTQVAEAKRSFERAMEEASQQSLAKWRLTLAGGLNSLVRTLGEQFQLEASSNTQEK